MATQRKEKTPKQSSSRLGLIILTTLVVLIAIVLQKAHPDLDWDNRFLPKAQKYMGNSTATTEHVFDGLTVLITGATSGIGKALTLSLTSKGATVIATGRSTEKLQALEEEIVGDGGSIVPIVMELSDLSAVSKAADEIKSKVEVIDVIVNNAGMHYMKGNNPLSASYWSNPTTVNGYDVVFAVNYLSHVLLVEKLEPVLQKSKLHPTVLQMSSSYHWGADGRDLASMNGNMPLAAQPGTASWFFRSTRAYANSKLAQILHALALQLDVSRRYRVASICPGWVGTAIAASEGTLMNKMQSLIASPSDGWGIASTYAALLDLDYNKKDDYDYHDFYINTMFSHLPYKMWNQFELPHWMADVGLRSMMLDSMAMVMIAMQKFFPAASPAKSSVESYNRTLAMNLYEWSKKELEPYL